LSLIAAATIRRAAIAARRQLLAQRAERLAWLQRQYQAFAAALASVLARHAAGGTVPISALSEVRRAADAQALTLGARIRTEMHSAIAAAAQLGVAAVGDTITGDARAIAVQRTLEALRAFVGADGLQLSDRIWRVRDSTRQVVVRALEQAITEGWSGIEAAQRLIGQGLAVTPEIRRAMAAAGLGNLQQLVANVLLRNPGNPLAAANRVMTTEINRAYTESFVAGLAENDEVAGVRFLLSPRHPKVDVCFRAGTLIATSRGDVPIEQVVIGDEVLTHLGRWRKVSRLYRSQALGRLVELHCQAASNRPPLVMTDNHPVLTHAGWKPAGDLSTSDHVLVLPPCYEASRAACASRKAAEDSPRNAQADAGGRIGAAQCDADPRPRRHSRGNCSEDEQMPSVGQSSDVGTCHWPCYHQTSSGFQKGALLQKASTGAQQASSTFLDAAYQSLDWLRQALGHRLSSSSARSSGSSLTQTIYRMLRRSVAWWRAPLDSSLNCKKTGCLFAPSTPALGSVGRRRGIGVPDRPCVSYVAVRVVRCAQTYSNQETVYNLEVAEDHSYVAGGVVVHNCDLHAGVNLHGMGPGVYPLGQHPYPAHPQTLSYLEAVFADEITDDDRAGKQTRSEWLRAQPGAKQDQIIGQAKGAAFRAGHVPEFGLRTPWRVLRERLARQGVDVAAIEGRKP